MDENLSGKAKKAKELWENHGKMDREEQKKARQTQWASANQDEVREREEREYIGFAGGWHKGVRELQRKREIAGRKDEEDCNNEAIK